MAAKDTNIRLTFNMTIAIYPDTDRGRSVWCPSPEGLRGPCPFCIGRPKEPESEHDVAMDIYIIIFLALAVFIFLRLRYVLGQRTLSERSPSIPLTGILLTLTAAALGAVFFDVGRANWYQTISGPARVIGGDTVVVGILLAMALCAGAALVLSFLHWKEWKSQKINPGLLHQKAQRVDPGIEREFNNVFMTTSKEGKQALIKRWMDRKKCDREEAMRLAIEELRRDNR
jgi:hypothetical protein